MEGFSVSQRQRLVELNAEDSIINQEFEDLQQRDQRFKELEKAYVKENKAKLRNLMEREHIPLTLRVERQLDQWLAQEEGFTRVATPVILSADSLAKMNIDQDNHLREQVFWVDGKKCMRPMLAPNLYQVMRELHRITRKPVKIFEAGS